MQQPFTHNKKKKTKALATAEKKVREAIEALKAASLNAENWGDFGTINYFAQSLDEVLNCDNNEAGLAPYIKKSA